MPSFELLINGKMVPGVGALDVVNPATEALVGTCSRASESQLDDAVDAARGVLANWSAMPIDGAADRIELYRGGENAS